MTQDELAPKCGLDKSQLSRIERGERGLDSVVMADLAEELGVEFRAFFSEPVTAFARSSQECAESDIVVSRGLELLDEIEACESLIAATVTSSES